MAVGERENETFPPSGDGNVCTVVGRRNDPLVNSLILMLLKTKEWDVRLADLTKKDGLGDLGENWSEVKIFGTDLMVRSQVFEGIACLFRKRGNYSVKYSIRSCFLVGFIRGWLFCWYP